MAGVAWEADVLMPGLAAVVAASTGLQTLLDSSMSFQPAASPGVGAGVPAGVFWVAGLEV